MLPVTGEHVVVVPQCTDGSHLCGFLPPALQPQAQFSLPLQGQRLAVQPSSKEHVAVQHASQIVVDAEFLARRRDVSGRVDELDHLGVTHGRDDLEVQP